MLVIQMSKYVNATVPTCCTDEGTRLAREKGWVLKADGKHGLRRVVASPVPLDVMQSDAIQVRACVCVQRLHNDGWTPLIGCLRDSAKGQG
jgi:hypothetical protein